MIQKLEAAAAGLERSAAADAGALQLSLREVIDDCIQIDAELAALEAIQDQVEAQRQLLASLGCPILRIRRDVLCAPLVGPYDRERSGQLRQALLDEVSRTRVRLVVLDVTGAIIPEPSAAEHLFVTCRALGLLGTRAVLTGFDPGLAQMIASSGEMVVGVPIYQTVEAALAGVSR